MRSSKLKIREKKSPDILFLEFKLEKYIKDEEYEKAVVKRWIDELSEKHKQHM